jgi:hypothetical protein
MVLMGYSGARRTLIYEKNLMSKISCQTTFKTAGRFLNFIIKWVKTSLITHIYPYSSCRSFMYSKILSVFHGLVLGSATDRE